MIPVLISTALGALLVFPSPASAAQPDARRTPVVTAVEKTSPAVVNIYTEQIVETPFRSRSPLGGNPFFDRFFDDFLATPRARKRERKALGSGVIVDESGIVVTNEHVIVQATNIRVLMADEREYAATLVGADSDSDLAVLRIDLDSAEDLAEGPSKLPALSLPSNDDILIGETVVAIGNPFGLSHTVTVGVVSAVGRTIHAADIVYHDFIQTDASINPGNSGGPLINVEGRLIGINTAIHAQGEGIGFAIPIYRVRNIVDQILHHGHVQPPWIGLQIQDLTPKLAFHFGTGLGTGVLINGVDAGSPAAQAGLERGQIITRAEGQPVPNSATFALATKGLTSGDFLDLRLLESGKSRKVTLTLVPIPDEVLVTFAWRGIGIAVQDHPSGDAVIVSKVRSGGPAERIGIQRADAIAAVGGRPVTDTGSFQRAMATLRNSNNVLLSIVRGRRLYRATLPIAR
jgi:serine protease Do